MNPDDAKVAEDTARAAGRPASEPIIAATMLEGPAHLLAALRGAAVKHAARGDKFVLLRQAIHVRKELGVCDRPAGTCSGCRMLVEMLEGLDADARAIERQDPDGAAAAIERAERDWRQDRHHDQQMRAEVAERVRGKDDGR